MGSLPLCMLFTCCCSTCVVPDLAREIIMCESERAALSEVFALLDIMFGSFR